MNLKSFQLQDLNPYKEEIYHWLLERSSGGIGYYNTVLREKS